MAENDIPGPGGLQDESVFDEYQVVAERPTLGALWELIQLVRPYWRGALWLAPPILVLGRAASLAEGAGVGVVVVLLSILLHGRPAPLEGGEGPLDVLAAHAMAFAGGSVALIGALAFAIIAARIVCIALHQLAAAMVEARISHRVRQAIFRA